MKYISGVFALNIEDSLETCGDWHTSALDWNRIRLVESDNTIFKDYGIERDKKIPEHTGVYNVANTLRAVLDLMIDGQTRYLKGFRDDFFCTDIYNHEFFEKVISLRCLDNWEEINSLMEREFMYEWNTFIKNKDDWRILHYEIIKDFLYFLNSKSNKFILKEGTALMLCYNLDRFSEDIYLDGFDRNDFFRIMDLFINAFCNKYNSINYIKAKDTDIVNGVYIHYGGVKPLKIEVSYRKSSIEECEYSVVNNICVYNIESILLMKIRAFDNGDKIRDLYDITFIYKNYKDNLNRCIIFMLKDAISFRGKEKFDYLIKNQEDDLIDNNRLAEEFSIMYYDLGLN